MREHFSGKIAKQLYRILQNCKSVLSPSNGTCAYCRSALRGSAATANPLKLCNTCYSLIPWIRKIQCNTCGRYETCHDCRRRENPALLLNRSAVRYDATMKEWLSLFKYRGDERLLGLFADMLIHAYRKLLEAEDGRGTSFDYIAFVPVSEERLMERGFNQAELLALELSKRVGIPVIKLLIRLRHTHKQSFKGRSERLKDLSGAFGVDLNLLAKFDFVRGNRPLRILLIDDVYTTGSTLHQCALEIRTHFSTAEVYGLTWAR